MAGDDDLVVLTNGGAEAVALVAQLERVGSVVDPEFSLYRRHLQEVRPDAPRWRSNPSNPLGLLADADATARVWDEAFYPLATGDWSRGDASRMASRVADQAVGLPRVAHRVRRRARR